MMKRVIPLLFAGAATATRLGISNVGVEEIGDQIEFSPEEFPSREELLQRARLLEEATLTGVNDEKVSFGAAVEPYLIFRGVSCS